MPGSTPSSASPVARSCRRTTRCSTRPRSGTSWSGTSRAPGTRPRATPPPPARSASAWRPAVPARPTSSRRSPTPRWTRCPIVAITGQVPSAAIGSDAFQEADIRGITMPDHQAQLPRHRPGRDPARDRRGVLHRLDRPPRPGARRHRQGRAAGDDDVRVPRDSILLPGYRPVTKPHAKQVREAARLIAESERPVLYVGGGVIRAEAQRGAARPGRAHPDPRGHHPDGARRLPGQPSRCTSACPACTARSPRSAPCSAATC